MAIKTRAKSPAARPEVKAYAEKIAALPDVIPAEQPKRTGRPSSGKVVVSLRLDPDVIAAFRATGPGWQARINETLKASLTRS